MGERFILLGEDRGVGKTLTLFFIANLLQEAQIDVVIVSSLIISNESFLDNTGWDIRKLTRPLYILIDFPDKIKPQEYDNFLDFLWNCITSQNQNKINFVIAMNKDHFDVGESISLIFGKFLKEQLNPFNDDEMQEIIQKRLEKYGVSIGQFLTEEALETLQKYSKGIPRNIIMACAILWEKCPTKPINQNEVARLFSETIYDTIITERIENIQDRQAMINIVSILKNQCNRRIDSKEEFLKLLKNNLGLGRPYASKLIDKLIRIGIFEVKRIGENRTNKQLTMR